MYEQEIKLTANCGAVLDAVLQSELVRGLDSGVGSCDAVRYLGIYYDTESHALEDDRYSLRARLEGERWRAALKFGGSIENGLSRRHELQTDISGPLENIGQLPRGELRDKVLDIIAEDAPLIARVTVDMKRSIRNLEIEGTAIELVTDNGMIYGMPHGRSRQVSLYEVELELVEGDLAKVIELGEALARAHALTPSIMTKHKIGLQLG